MKMNYAIMDVPEDDLENGKILEVLKVKDRIEAYAAFEKLCLNAVNSTYLYEYETGVHGELDVISFKQIGSKVINIQ